MKPHPKQLGSQIVHIEGDLMFLKWTGEFLPDEITGMHASLEGMLAEHDIVLMLVDASEGRSMRAEARRRAASWSYAHRLGGVALFGASLTVRTLVTIVMAMQRLLVPKKGFPVEFTKTELGARAWIDARRREIRSRQAESQE